MISDKRNLKIELLRFWFTMVICLHHFRMYSPALPYGGGYIAVDFFFMISGYFLAKHVDANKRTEYRWKAVAQYAGNRYMRLLPAYLLAFILAFAVRKIWLKDTFAGTVGGYIREAFMVEFFSNGSNERMNPADWYCGYLLLASITLYLLLVSGKRLWKSGFFLLVALAGYILLLFLQGHVNIFPKEANVFSIAFVRALAGLCAGGFLYKVSDTDSHKATGKQWTCIASIVFLFVSYMVLWDNAYRFTDYIVIFLLGFLIWWCVNSDWTYQNERVNRMIALAGTFSYTLFLNHFLIVRIFTMKQYFATLDWKILSLCYLFVAIVFSMGMFILEKGLRKFISVLGNGSNKEWQKR